MDIYGGINMSRNQFYIKLVNSTKWRNIRNEMIKKYPLCQVCGRKLSECVHHIKPLENYTNNFPLMEELAYSKENLMCLCRECHKNLHLEMKLHKNQKESVKRNNKERTDDFMNRYFE